MKVTGDFENKKYSKSSLLVTSFTKNSKRAVDFYVLSLFSFIFLGVTYFGQAEFFGYITAALFYLRPVFIILFYFFGIRAMLDHGKFNEKISKKKDTSIWLIFILFGFLIYIFMHFSIKKKMKEELQMI